MRILMLAQFYPPIIGGEERHVKTLSEALVRRGHTVSVATLQHGDTPEIAVENGVTVHRLRGTLQRIPALFGAQGRQHAPPFADPELSLALERIMQAEKPHIVHAHNWMLHSFLPLKKRHNAGVLATLHDYSLVCAKKNMIRQGVACTGPGIGKCLPCASGHYGAVKGAVTVLASRFARNFAMDRVDKFIAVSQAVADRSGLTAGGHEAEVIPNFIPDDLGLEMNAALYETQLSQLPKGDFILFVGDLMILKGIETLLAAYAALKNAPPLVMIGRRCSETPTELPPNTHVFDSWPHGAVIEAWRRCMFGILPSIGLEACATVVMEANAVGRPMIVTEVGGLPEIVDDGISGLLVPPGDAEALKAAMRRLIEDAPLRARMSAASRVKAETLMAGAIVPRIEQAYRDVGVKLGVRLTDPAGFQHSTAAGA